MKALTPSPAPLTRNARDTGPWAAMWEWIARPMHYSAVRALRTAAQSGSTPRLSPLLHPHISVAVTSADPVNPTTVVARGTRDAVPLLLYGLAPRPGVLVAERSVNGQAGLVMSLEDEVVAMIIVDFTGRLVSLVWVKLRPEHAHHWLAYRLTD